MKQKLRVVRQRHHLTMDQVARKAGLSSGVYYQAELGVTVDQAIASRILQALTLLTGHLYTEKNVLIAVQPQEQQGHASSPLHPVMLLPARVAKGGTVR